MLVLLAAWVAEAGVSRGQSRPDATPLWVAVDRDDDDVNGRADNEEESLQPSSRADLVRLPAEVAGATVKVAGCTSCLRLVADGVATSWTRPMAPGASVQGLAPGRVDLELTKGNRTWVQPIVVLGVRFRDGERRDVSAATEWASLERTPPARVEIAQDQAYEDPDALRVVAEVPDGIELPMALAIETVSAAGIRMDTLPSPDWFPVACRPGSKGVRCVGSRPIRLVIDDVDRNHVVSRERSLRGEVGGALVVRAAGRKLQAIRVAGPRRSPLGPIGISRARVRPIVMRLNQGGAPAIGGTDGGAIGLVRSEMNLAAAVWGQCGITFRGGPDVSLASPPPAHLLSFGDDLGLPAAGGEVRFLIDRRAISIPLTRGATSAEMARVAATAATRAGFQAILSPNARIAPGAAPSVDISVRHLDGTPANLEPWPAGIPLSTDPSLSVRIGAVDLADGLDHFTDSDSMAGTLEERTLLKALDDGDPSTIEVVVVPFFSGGGRIGESFIFSDQSSLRNMVLVDRAGVRARRSSLTLAHELGHVLMDMPGHPDDHGVDTPTLLMDADASDGSAFGPRRLRVEDCVRVMRQSGPHARLPLLEPQPFAFLRY